MERAVQGTSYRGVERRHNKVYVTRNTEYHTHDGVCVRVRDRKTNLWNDHHIALGRRLSGSLHPPRSDDDPPVRREPVPGDTLLFDAGERHIITSTLLRTERPPREIAAQYPEPTPLPPNAA